MCKKGSIYDISRFNLPPITVAFVRIEVLPTSMPLCTDLTSRGITAVGSEGRSGRGGRVKELTSTGVPPRSDDGIRAIR